VKYIVFFHIISCIRIHIFLFNFGKNEDLSYILPNIYCHVSIQLYIVANSMEYNFWFLVSFSFLSIVLHFFPVPRVVHNVLYSCNMIALVGITVINLIVPSGMYDLYNPTFESIFGIHLSISIWNVLLWIMHFLPVYLFRKTHQFGNPLYGIILYLLIFGPYLHIIYPLRSITDNLMATHRFVWS
jgi:hypothetical protein